MFPTFYIALLINKMTSGKEGEENASVISKHPSLNAQKEGSPDFFHGPMLIFLLPLLLFVKAADTAAFSLIFSQTGPVIPNLFGVAGHSADPEWSKRAQE